MPRCPCLLVLCALSTHGARDRLVRSGRWQSGRATTAVTSHEVVAVMPGVPLPLAVFRGASGPTGDGPRGKRHLWLTETVSPVTAGIA